MPLFQSLASCPILTSVVHNHNAAKGSRCPLPDSACPTFSGYIPRQSFFFQTYSGSNPNPGRQLSFFLWARRLVDGFATFTRIEGEDSCISTVADELGKNEWVHFGCHGIPNQEQPFESAFALRDGRFTIQHIIQCDSRNPEFAYLSACHTTVGDRECTDEVIHLASAMQFAGFRSVIGTMWGVDDSETNKVISLFYKLMIGRSGRLDYIRAARALQITMKKVDIPVDQRILYIHLGA